MSMLEEFVDHVRTLKGEALLEAEAYMHALMVPAELRLPLDHEAAIYRRAKDPDPKLIPYSDIVEEFGLKDAAE